MKNAHSDIPVYDLCSIERDRVHKDISAGEFDLYCKIRDKLEIPHRHAYYHIILFIRGEGKFTIDFEKFEIIPGRIYFMLPGQVHCWELNNDKEGFAVNFTQNLLSSFLPMPQDLDHFPFLRGIPKLSVIDLEGESLKEAIFFLGQIINESKKKDDFSLNQVCYYLMSLFISISRYKPQLFKQSIPLQKQSTLFNFRKLINQYYLEKRLPKDYAAMLFMSPNHLNTICQEILGKSAGELIRERILLEAKRLLINADLTIAEIAFRLNFTDNSYFTKFFKKYTGTTPEEFRMPILHNH